jgi:hypothetical protein
VDRKRTNPKSHHYVPESYLWRFADTRGFQHIRDRARRQTRRQRQDQVMAINAYYCQTWAAQGVDPNIFEIELGKGLESEARGVIDKLIMSPQSLNEYDTASLLNYLEVQRIRVPRQAETAKVLMRDAILNSAPTDVVARITAGHLQLTIWSGRYSKHGLAQPLLLQTAQCPSLIRESYPLRRLELDSLAPRSYFLLAHASFSSCGIQSVVPSPR